MATCVCALQSAISLVGLPKACEIFSNLINFLLLLQGTQIEASVWRDLADKYYDLLEEGKASYCPCTVTALLLLLTDMHTLANTLPVLCFVASPPAYAVLFHSAADSIEPNWLLIFQHSTFAAFKAQSDLPITLMASLKSCTDMTISYPTQLTT